MTRNGDEIISDKVHQEIATTLGVSKADVATMDARLSGPDVSLNAPLSDDDQGSSVQRMDIMPDTAPLQDETVGESIDSDRRMKWLKAALSVLSDREMRILRERRLNEEQATLESLGGSLGISKERVRQIENRALEKLKKALLERHPKPETVLA